MSEQEHVAQISAHLSPTQFPDGLLGTGEHVSTSDISRSLTFASSNRIELEVGGLEGVGLLHYALPRTGADH